jgi:hypothetical protein
MTVLSEEMQSALVTIREFLDGKGDPWAWDDFLSVPTNDPAVSSLQGICRQLPSQYPPERKIDYCSNAGMLYLRHVLEEMSRRSDVASG